MNNYRPKVDQIKNRSKFGGGGIASYASKVTEPDTEEEYTCSECKLLVRSAQVRKFSTKKYGSTRCWECQNKKHVN